MTSDRRTKANRENARASTGPKTARGRARSARNALRHGLTLPVYSDPALSKEVETLAREIIATDANAEFQELAHEIAESQIDLCRVRHARQRLLSSALGDPNYASRADERQMLKFAIKATKGRRLIPHPQLAPFDTVHTTISSFLSSMGLPADALPEGPQKLATILSDMSKQLAAMDRYERRALSRRNAAIRALDAARRVLR